jgi:hypothetical protein
MTYWNWLSLSERKLDLGISNIEELDAMFREIIIIFIIVDDEVEIKRKVNKNSHD